MVGFRTMHQHNWWSRTGSCVGDGCAVGLQPMHGASSLDCGGVCRHLLIAHSRYGQSPELCKVILARGTPMRPIAAHLTFVSRTCSLSGCTFQRDVRSSHPEQFAFMFDLKGDTSMHAYNLKVEQMFDPKKHVEKVLGTIGEGDVTIACWEPGQCSPNHLHPNCTEVYFCFEGGGTMRTLTQEVAVVPGSFVVHPRGELHEYENGPERSLLFRIRYGGDMSTITKKLARQSQLETATARPCDVSTATCLS